ncbi:MAG: hypothetical protein R3E67_01625 [Pseudomonadales bacterium]
MKEEDAEEWQDLSPLHANTLRTAKTLLSIWIGHPLRGQTQTSAVVYSQCFVVS